MSKFTLLFTATLLSVVAGITETACGRGFGGMHGGSLPFEGKKGLTSEGGFRVPQLVRWPGKIKPGTIINDIFSQEDWLPTLLAAANGGVDTDIQARLKKGGVKADGKTFKAHLDGFHQMDLLTGEGPGKRNEIFYFSADGDLCAIRVGDWKVNFTEMSGSLPTAWKWLVVERQRAASDETEDSGR